jgi:signal transduction histidine kinase
MRLMELNLQQNASLLANSDLSMSRKEFSTLGQEFIDDVIGDDKVNMIVAIYSGNGNVLYRNDNAHIFELPNTIEANFPTWEDNEYNDFLIKYLTQVDPKSERIIKVGMILNQSLIRWKDLNQRVSIFVVIILFVITLISFFLSHILFKPVHHLAEQVNLMAEKLEEGEYTELKSWFHKLKSKSGKNDEFTSLIHSLDKLSTKITETQKLTQRWSALMAHELKTPMTILRMSIEEMIQETNASPKAVTSVENELKKLEEIIMDFLEWASVENDSSKPELHVIYPIKRTKDIILELQKTAPQRKISFHHAAAGDFKLFCNPLHFDQLVYNLVMNSIKHGQGEITVEIQESSLKIIDQGMGIPDSVLNNFGKPFNKHQQRSSSGHGLGLAWVNTITKKYGWNINFRNMNGAIIEVVFPIEDE